MAISSFPFDGQDTTEIEFSRLMGQFHETGVAASAGSDALKVTTSGGALTVQVDPGFAVINGFGFYSTASETLNAPAPASGTAVHRVVLRLDMTANQIVFEVVQGTAGQGAPALTQGAPGAAVHQMPLASISVTAGQTAILPSDITDERPFVGNQVGVWLTDALRPTAPRVGQVGYNVGRNALESWQGFEWLLVASDSPGTIKMHVKVEPGYLPLDGRVLAKTEYPALAAALGVVADSFAIPNMTGAYPKGVSAAAEVFATGGANEKVIEHDQMPLHSHDFSHDHGQTNNDGQHAHGHLWSNSSGNSKGTLRTGSWNGGAITNQGNNLGVVDNGSAHSHDVPAHQGQTGTAGEDLPFNVEPANVGLMFVIKT